MNVPKVKILHITPHLGTGVGAVVLNYLKEVKADQNFEHRIACLDYANDLAKSTAKLHGFLLYSDMSQSIEELLKMIKAADIVLIHWWNHPLLYDLLVRQFLPACRLILWSHVTGSPAPNNFTTKLLSYPDKMVFTTPLSFNTKEVKMLMNLKSDQFCTIWSTGGAERLRWITPKPHDGFNVGYIGNLDPVKIHPNFLEICNQIKIPEAHFIVVGGPDVFKSEWESKADSLDIAKKFTFTGFVSEEEKWNLLSTFDVFGYPLAPHHYGSSDQILQESMAAGIVPVVLNNPMESFMVNNRECGFVANNFVEYARAIESLYHDRGLRLRLSQQARKYALKNFSLIKMKRQFNELFEQILLLPKTEKRWAMEKNSLKIKASDVFLESLGEYGQPFLDYLRAENHNSKQKARQSIKMLAQYHHWRSASKSTAHQYHAFFPKDERLQIWSDLTKG